MSPKRPPCCHVGPLSLPPPHRRGPPPQRHRPRQSAPPAKCDRCTLPPAPSELRRRHHAACPGATATVSLAPERRNPCCGTIGIARSKSGGEGEGVGAYEGLIWVKPRVSDPPSHTANAWHTSSPVTPPSRDMYDPRRPIRCSIRPAGAHWTAALHLPSRRPRAARGRRPVDRPLLRAVRDVGAGGAAQRRDVQLRRAVGQGRGGEGKQRRNARRRSVDSLSRQAVSFWVQTNFA